MVTVLRSGGLWVRIYKDEHPPAHVHVFTGSRRQGGEAKIDLGGEDGPDLVWAVGMTKAEVRKAFELVTEHRDMLLKEWRLLHG